MPWHDYDENSFDDVELPEEDMDTDNAGEDTHPCPYCREPIYEDAVRCPHCGNYLSREDAPLRRPVWMIVGALICLVIAVLWALGRW
jgi:predicted nucleic acid-binding Zn ribbon protein